MNLHEIIEQLKSCDYECEAGALENNVAFQELYQRAKEYDDMRSALIGLVGVETMDDLKGMEYTIRATDAPKKDKASILDAIHALMDTAPKE